MVFKYCEPLEIEFLTCLISYNKCDTGNNEKRVSGISILQTYFLADFCDTFLAKQHPLR